MSNVESPGESQGESSAESPQPIDRQSPRLPLELLGQITKEAINDILEEEHWDREGRTAQLTRAAAFSLISREILPFAQAALYSTIRLEQRHPPYMDTNDGLLETLENHPHLGQLVRRLQLETLSEETEGDSDGMPILDVERVSSCCPRIDHFEEYTLPNDQPKKLAQWPSVLPAFGASNSPFVSLKLCELFNLDLTRMVLGAATRLQHLDIFHACFAYDFEAPPLPLQLQSFRLGYHEPDDDLDYLLDYFVSESHDSLSHLTLALGFQWSLPKLTHFTKLVSLHIEENVYGLQAEDVLKVCAPSNCPALIRLQLSSAEPDPFAAALTKEGILARLPMSLAQIDIGNLPFPIPHLTNYLKSRSTSSSLGRLRISKQGRSKFKAEDKKERKDLRKAARLAGVEIITCRTRPSAIEPRMRYFDDLPY